MLAIPAVPPAPTQLQTFNNGQPQPVIKLPDGRLLNLPHNWNQHTHKAHR